ncbi:MAG: Hsp20/alpha crystallin family protein [Leptospiraceae bacterium]|nr:Hsp20/alpha crystallin family protein [Leptospiraceae bacterium]
MLNLLERNDIWREIDRVEEWANSLLGNGGYYPKNPYPAVNIYYSDEGAELVALVPGYGAEDLDISVHENRIRLKGTAPKNSLVEGLKLERREAGKTEFTRVFEVNFRVDSNKIEANYKNGVLRVKLPRLEEDKPKKISIQTK